MTNSHDGDEGYVRAVDRIVVVGLSLAGLRAVETLRRLGHEGVVVAIDPDPYEPYDRPPLSKELLSGKWDAAQVALRKQGLDDLAVERRRERAVDLDLGGRAVVLESGERVDFDTLVVATGATPRRLPMQSDLDGVHMLRTLDDGLELRARLEQHPRRVVVVGAGFIGSEVAATCRGRGLDVTVLEALPQPMVRGLGERIGAVCADLHRDHGVDLRLSAGVESVEGDGRVERVRLTTGEVIEADVVVVGIGVVPRTEWLERSGLTLDNGVVCDATCAAAPGVVVAGDVCRWPNALFDGALMRLEHWTNAAEQGAYVGERLVRAARDEPIEPFTPVPFVWSDQYDVKIQSAGWFDADDDVEVVSGSLDARKFTAVFGRAGRLVGVLGFSQPRQVMQYRRLVAERAPFAEALAAAG
jgi:3-phenylpropionate/trans-cinnamate dioxygenase ferredoxin reductase component